MNKQKSKKKWQSDPLTSIATMVWYVIGMAFIALLLGIPHFLFWDSLPAAIQLWLDPQLLLAVTLVVASIFILFTKNLLGRK